MPKYTIYLHDRQFGMEDYVAEVLIRAREADNDNGPYCFLGHGTNKELAIQPKSPKDHGHRFSLIMCAAWLVEERTY